jgi:hypothetical protein
MEHPHKKPKASSGAMTYAHIIMKDFAQQRLHPDEGAMDYKGLKYVNTTVSVVLRLLQTHRTDVAFTGKSTRTWHTCTSSQTRFAN